MSGLFLPPLKMAQTKFCNQEMASNVICCIIMELSLPIPLPNGATPATPSRHQPPAHSLPTVRHAAVVLAPCSLASGRRQGTDPMWWCVPTSDMRRRREKKLVWIGAGVSRPNRPSVWLIRRVSNFGAGRPSAKPRPRERSPWVMRAEMISPPLASLWQPQSACSPPRSRPTTTTWRLPVW